MCFRIKNKFLILLIILLGLYRCIALFISFEELYPEKCYMTIIAEIIDVKEEKEYYDKYIIKVVKNEKNNKSKNTKIILYTKKELELSIGDIIKVTGEFEKVQKRRNYKGFDYRNYLNQKKIYGILKEENILKIDKKINIKSLLQILINKLNLIYDTEQANFLKGILLGKSSELSDDIKENFKNSSTYHILAISGMHVSYVLFGFNFVLEKIVKNIKIKNFLLILLLIFFSIITGCSSSCIRACFMSGMILISKNMNKKYNFFISFILIFLILLFDNIYNLFNVGLWLSFFGTLGIILFYDFIKKIFFRRKFNSNIFIIKIIDPIIISCSAQILIFPIILYNFNTFSFTFFISNIIISFLIGPILILGYFSLFFSFFSNFFSKILCFIESLLIHILFNVTKICSQLPFSKIYFITPYFLYIFLYYLLILFFIIYYKNNKFKIFKFILNPKKFLIKNVYCYKVKYKIFISKLKKNNLKKYIFFIILIFFILFYCLYNKSLKIYFVDVGQGDCTIIKTPQNKNIIIDGGEGSTNKYDYGKNVVIPYLLDRKIRNIDYLIVSHFDSDHVGGLISILEELKVKKIIISKQGKNSDNLIQLIKIAKQKNIDIILINIGDRLIIEKDLYIDIFWPDHSNLIKENIINNNSIVLKLNYNKFSMLFTGDIEEIAEKQIVKTFEKNIEKINSTVLKVAHHGSKTSTTLEFLEMVSPKIALIGVGQNNKFGHPNKQVIERLQNNGVKIFRTDQDGEINIVVNQKGNIVKVKKCVE